MTLNYDRVWKTLNELESVTSKICSARAILDSAIISLESGNREKTETLMYAVDEYLQYYLEEFDRKFKDAWDETVTKLKQEEVDDYMRPWGHSDMEALSQYTDEELEGMCNNAAKEDKVVRWQLPVEEDAVNGEYFITFPDDLLEAANLKEGDDVEWIDNNDGSFILKKSEKQLNHDEAIAAGWTMTDDGFWVKE
jgi:bifunctional DNA-binding transcriptional regulator/antitoxin component of YhaV-PrlF toxin-antitoxin module